MGESQKKNDLFFVCSLVEHIARRTKNTKKAIIDQLGKENVKKIYELAEVYHAENLEKVSDELIHKFQIKEGRYDILAKCQGRIPTVWELGRIYQRLILMLNPNVEESIDTFIEVLSSWMIQKIDNYNSSMYYENPSYLYECYVQDKII